MHRYWGSYPSDWATVNRMDVNSQSVGRRSEPAGSLCGYRITPTHLNIGTITKMTATATVEALGFDAFITKRHRDL